MDDTNDSFRWPDSPPYPPQSWFEMRGAELELEPAQIRFAVALLLCGGPDSRNNTIAARTAGLDLDRTQAFRLARSVKVRKLINEAEQTRKGERRPLTEDEIDGRIDRMIASPHDLAAAKGIELRDKRKTQREERERAVEHEHLPHGELHRRLICAIPARLGPALGLGHYFEDHGNLTSFPWIKQVAPFVAQTFPTEWNRWRDKHDESEKAILDTFAAGPFLAGDDLVAALGGKVHHKRATQ
jgi:hypothetical protein